MFRTLLELFRTTSRKIGWISYIETVKTECGKQGQSNRNINEIFLFKEQRSQQEMVQQQQQQIGQNL